MMNSKTKDIAMLLKHAGGLLYLKSDDINELFRDKEVYISDHLLGVTFKIDKSFCRFNIYSRDTGKRILSHKSYIEDVDIEDLPSYFIDIINNQIDKMSATMD